MAGPVAQYLEEAMKSLVAIGRQLNSQSTAWKGLEGALAQVRTVTQHATGVISPLLSGIRGVAAEMIAFTRTTEAMKNMAQAGANALRQPFQVLDSGISAIQLSVARFVQHVDPGAIFQFTFAVNSLYATIGKALVPVLNESTRIIRAIASGISGANAHGQQLIAALAAGVVGLVAGAAAMTAFGFAVAIVEDIITGGFASAFQALGAVLGAVGGAAGGVALATGMLTPIFEQLAPVISGVMNSLGGALAAFGDMVEAIGPALQAGVEHIAAIMDFVGQGLARLAPAFAALFDVLSAVEDAIQPLRELLLTVFVETVVTLGRLFTAISPALVMAAQGLGALTSLVGELGKLGVVLMAPLTELLVQLTTVGIELFMALNPVVPLFIQITHAVADMVKTVAHWIRELLSLLGIQVAGEFQTPKGETKPAQQPVGHANFSDPLAAIREAQKNSFQLGGPGGAMQKPDVEIAKNTANISGQVNEMKTIIGGLVKDVGSAATVLQSIYDTAKVFVANFKMPGLNQPIEVPGTGGATVTPADVAKFAIPGLRVLDAIPDRLNPFK